MNEAITAIVAGFIVGLIALFIISPESLGAHFGDMHRAYLEAMAAH